MAENNERELQNYVKNGLLWVESLAHKTFYSFFFCSSLYMHAWHIGRCVACVLEFARNVSNERIDDDDEYVSNTSIFRNISSAVERKWNKDKYNCKNRTTYLSSHTLSHAHEIVFARNCMR